MFGDFLAPHPDYFRGGWTLLRMAYRHETLRLSSVSKGKESLKK